MTRQAAREAIVQAANRHMLRSGRRRGGYPVRLLSMRQLQRAVFVCRQNLLVDGKVLEAAGFRARRSAA
jgi:hypothetical protein